MMFTSFGATNGFYPPFEYELGCLQLAIKISVENQNWIRQFEENLFGNAKTLFPFEMGCRKITLSFFQLSSFKFSGNDKIISQ